MSIQNNQLFFFTWFLLDFSQKIASGTLSLLVLLTLRNIFAGISLITTVGGLSLNYWYASMTNYFIQKHFDRVPRGDNLDELVKVVEEDSNLGLYGCPITELDESIFPRTTCCTSVRAVCLKFYNFKFQI